MWIGEIYLSELGLDWNQIPLFGQIDTVSNEKLTLAQLIPGAQLVYRLGFIQ